MARTVWEFCRQIWTTMAGPIFTSPTIPLRVPFIKTRRTENFRTSLSRLDVRFAIRAKRTSSLDSDVLKFSVLLVLIKGTRSGIVGDVNIGPAIVVQICRQNSQTVRAIGTKNY